MYIVSFLVILICGVMTHNNDQSAVMATSNYSIPIAGRYQWNENHGYCGEVSFISAGLHFGQYVSQYETRALASPGVPQNKASSQLLIGVNGAKAASAMRLNYEEWDTVAENNTDYFLLWIKQHVAQGHPVVIGVYMNQYRFDGNTSPSAGDPQYDHIVPVIGTSTNHSVNSYHGSDTLTLSDNAEWERDDNPPYFFTYRFDEFQLSRKQANAKNGPLYSTADNAENYGIALTGVVDLKHETLPVSVETNVNYERPEIKDGTSTRPAAMPLTLTITVHDVVPNVSYVLYKYTSFNDVPESDFNGNSGNAASAIKFTIDSGSTYTTTDAIQSDELAIYRC
ncbi:hypothetical protein SAMD00019534_057700, partial [Acytostelium subglobosum LB1]|uniref:hypothetical protein n=1 Tax=Acytostelium subglobosum LB1 TaxID=1410327 RepID=UPI0006450CD4